MSRTPTIDLPRNKVRQITVTPETGEIIEQVKPVAAFREDANIPDPPAPPKHPSPPVGSIGWIAVKWADYEQAKEDHGAAMTTYRAEAEGYWEHFATKLTRAERLGLARKDIVGIVRPFEPGWEKGDLLPITDKITARVESVKAIEEGFRTTVILEDFRSFYMKRIVGGSDQPKTDENGYAIEPTPGAKEAARFDGAYTQTKEQAVEDGGEVLENRLYERLHRERDMGNALRQSKARVKVTKGRLERRIADARGNHRNSTANRLERQLKCLEAKEAQKGIQDASAATS